MRLFGRLAVNLEWLDTELIEERDEVFFHPTQKQIVARHRRYWDDLLLEETPTSVIDDDQAAESTDGPFRLRLRLQGNTLRIVLMPSEQDSFCAVPEQITGSYRLSTAGSRFDWL